MKSLLLLLLAGCCLVLAASGRSLLDEPYDTLKDAIATPSTPSTPTKPGTASDESCGRFGKCKEGYVCEAIEAQRCKRDVTPKSVCSDSKVCVSGSTDCGNSKCSVNERCVRADSCKLDPEEVKSALKEGDKSKIKFSFDPDCFVCKPRDVCVEKKIEECVEDPDNCEEVQCEDLEKVCTTTEEEKCQTVLKPVCSITKAEECADVSSEVCFQVQTKACGEVGECTTPEPSCKTVTVEICEPAEPEDCNCKTVTTNKCEEGMECKSYPKTVCKKNANDEEVCTEEQEEKCTTVEDNCVDVEEEVCDEGCTGGEKAPVCKTEDETICVQLDPVCSANEDESCEPEYEEECTTEVTNECVPVEFEECVEEEVEACEVTPVETCKYVPSKDCEGVTKVCKEKCTPKIVKECDDTAGVKCNGAICGEGEICDYKCETVYSEPVCTTEDFLRCIPDWAAESGP